jgi:hypothetical protein
MDFVPHHIRGLTGLKAILARAAELETAGREREASL